MWRMKVSDLMAGREGGCSEQDDALHKGQHECHYRLDECSETRCSVHGGRIQQKDALMMMIK
jgi:hypothetical protein